MTTAHRDAFQTWLSQPAPQNPGVPQTTDASLPLLVVGASPAGLAGMAALRRAGIPFVGIDLHGAVGGIWDITNPVSSVYEGMRTVTSRYTTYLDMPAPEDWPDYIPHDRAKGYLQQFAESAGVLPHLEFKTRYLGAAKTPRGTWQVTLRRTDGDEQAFEREFRGIVFATGAHHREVTLIPEELRAQAAAAGLNLLHSADYKEPGPFAGRRVLIVGVGNSGSDIADKISHVAQRTILAIRTTPWINPQTLFGVPCDKLTRDTPAWFPRWYKLSTFHLARWLTVGGFRRLGLRTPRHSINDRLPIGDRGIVRAITSGRVTVRSHVTSLAGGVAQFADASQPSEPVDDVLFATGFERRYPLLEVDSRQGSEVSDALAFLAFHRQEPGLAYLAEAVGFRGCWPVFCDQARAVAAYFAAEAQGGRNVREFNLRRGNASPDFKGDLFAKSDGFHVDYDIYSRALSDLAAWLAR